jgi:glycosyltransferase involved in cell wall biosynthesis
MPSVSISVAMATCNGEAHLPSQLQSLNLQVRRPDELMVCDDASTDRTVDILARFAREVHFPVKIIQNPSRLGPCANFLKAARHCRGELIAFCDQDDIWFPHKLARCARRMKRNNAGLMIHSIRNVFQQGRMLRAHGGCHHRTIRTHGSRIRADSVAHGMSMVFRSSLRENLDWLKSARDAWYEANLRHRSEWLQDHWSHAHDLLCLTVARLTGNICFDSEVLALHRLHEGNHTTRMPGHDAAVPEAPRSERQAARLPRTYRRMALACSDNVSFFRSLGAETPAAAIIRSRGIRYYRRWMRIYDWRARLHEPDNRFPFLATAFLRMLGAGAYRGRYDGGMGTRSLLKDMWTVARSDLAFPSGPAPEWSGPPPDVS